MSEEIRIQEVGPRDGLQNEDRYLEPAARSLLVAKLAACGLKRIEAVSFVRDDRVPAMAGAEVVMSQLERRPGTVYSGLVLNARGYERALVAGVDEVHLTVACTEAFSQANQGMGVDQAVAMARELVRRAHADKKPVTATLSVAFWCPFEGRVEPARVISIAAALQDEGPAEVVLADTIGAARPPEVKELVRRVVALGGRVGVHLHDTRGMASANALYAIDAGGASLDASVGGAGGCPFAPGATGNVATEDLVYLLEGLGIRTAIDLARLVEVTTWLEGQLGHPLPSPVARAFRARPFQSSAVQPSARPSVD